MTRIQTISEDKAELLREEFALGNIDRRSFMRLSALLGVAAAVGSGTAAFAQSKEIVLANAGGNSVRGFEQALTMPFMKDNPGIKVVIDGTQPNSARIKAMVQAGDVYWDVCDRNLPASIELGQQGLLEEIDYTIVDKSKLRSSHTGRWGCGEYLYANVIAYQTDLFDGRKPMTWKDFWNVKDFPGKRALRKHIDGQLEAALLADGVEPQNLYPIDLKRALDKIKEIKPHCIFWETGSEAQQLLRDREVVMENIWNHRAAITRRDTNKRVDFHFNQGIAWVAAWIVPKGNKAGKEVFRFIASTQDPARQVELFKLVGNGPINPAASAITPEELRVIDPGSPTNFPLQIPVDAQWYADNSAIALTRYIETVS